MFCTSTNRAVELIAFGTCKKVFKATKTHLKTWQSPRKWESMIWKKVIKEFMDRVYIIVE